MLTVLSNKSATVKASSGVKKVLTTDQLPVIIEGAYPVLLSYCLPGKNIETHTKQIIIKY